MDNIKDKTVAQIVTENIKTSDVFKRNGIDFCCGGNVNIQSACEEQGLDFEKLEKELDSVHTSPVPTHDFDSWNLDFLVDYIINTHHTYCKNNFDILIEYANKVASAHGENHPEVITIAKLTETLVNDLRPHLEKEEQILFPYIKHLIEIKSRNEKVSHPGLQSPVSVMEKEHDLAGDVMKEIASISTNFTVPEGGCNTFIAMYAKLEEFQNDLFQHIHLENNILFPKAIALEEDLSL
tara:strand:+ start:19001 stop:19714 length:714 start_codon:yes stop_codon:yes gene_type:complete